MDACLHAEGVLLERGACDLQLFRSLPIPAYVSTLADGRILEVSGSFLDLFAYRREEVLGRTESELGLWDGEHEREAALSQLGEDPDGLRTRTRMRSRTSRVRHVELHGELVVLEGERCVLMMVRDVTERLAFEREMERLALHDVLTGLPNRRLFLDRLEHALRRCRREPLTLAVLFMDLDRFKSVNDTLGHAAGDEVLTRVAERIQTCFREQDTVSRLGGDEFAVLLEDAGDRQSLEEVVGRVSEAFRIPFLVDGVPVRLGLSVGIAVSSGDGASADALLRLSDSAMYEAKRSGRETFRFYDPSPA
jgi:diguanylate cyclase (GGDEF)-like protein/PAS domain S-box-containing protein